MRLEPRPLTTVEPASTRNLGQLEEVAPGGHDICHSEGRPRFSSRGACTVEVWRPLRHDHVLSTEHLVLLNFDRDKSDQQCEAGDDPGE
jgi:hypothetical protein